MGIGDWPQVYATDTSVGKFGRPPHVAFVIVSDQKYGRSHIVTVKYAAAYSTH